MQLGDIEILPVLDSDWVNDPREAFAKSPEALEAHKDLLTPDGMLAMPWAAFSSAAAPTIGSPSSISA